MAEESSFPLADEELLDKARSALASQRWTVAGRQVAEDIPLRVGARNAFRRTVDGRIVAYSVRILVDPKLGVPCDSPDEEPRWGSRGVLHIMLDENGDALICEPIRCAFSVWWRDGCGLRPHWGSERSGPGDGQGRARHGPEVRRVISRGGPCCWPADRDS